MNYWCNYYFEFRYYEHSGFPAKYCVRYCGNEPNTLPPLSVFGASNRVWLEDAEGVRYGKNCNEKTGSDTPVDMKEFLCVKLSATVI